MVLTSSLFQLYNGLIFFKEYLLRNIINQFHGWAERKSIGNTYICNHDESCTYDHLMKKNELAEKHHVRPQKIHH